METGTPLPLRVRLQENPLATVQACVETALHLERVWGSVDMPGDAPQTLVGPYGKALLQQLVVGAVEAHSKEERVRHSK